MKLHLLEARQKLPVSTREAWDFFSGAGNLARITPPSRDRVRYALPRGTGAVGRLLAAPRLREIFACRRQVLERAFGAWKD